MIAKISATENLGGALGYNFKKVEKGDAEVILSKGLYQSAEGEFKMEEVLRDMQALIPTQFAERRRSSSIVPSILIRMNACRMRG